jgi:hypothetical protein
MIKSTDELPSKRDLEHLVAKAKSPRSAARASADSSQASSMEAARAVLRDHVAQTHFGDRSWRARVVGSLRKMGVAPARFAVSVSAAAAVLAPLLAGSVIYSRGQSAAVERVDAAIEMVLKKESAEAAEAVRVFKEDAGKNGMVRVVFSASPALADSPMSIPVSCTATIGDEGPEEHKLAGKLSRYAGIDSEKSQRLLDLARMSECIAYTKAGSQGIDAAVQDYLQTDSYIEAARAMLVADQIDYDQFERISQVMLEREDLDPRWAAGLKESLRRGTQLHVLREGAFDSSARTYPDSPEDEPVCIDLIEGDGVCERDRRGQRGG